MDHSCVIHASVISPSRAVHTLFTRRSRIVTGLTAPAPARRCATARFSGTIGATRAAVRRAGSAWSPARHGARLVPVRVPHGAATLSTFDRSRHVTR
ncbi:hypothetical protein [Paraburkholderia fungorum]|uniref:Uncharacterized protein n=1 Tax=Paraburkholderia fungorum TaxID=134537 RepID=A0AAP5UTC0_9BURK|nr:hypothetical protein [Paraburkholderia fungorum]MDT8838185.1 hypothetical protein [Paraburkholderia fungorum]PRZ48116.1 hypothetical protein BX589_12870 [Paraburkholderia fungorum]